MARKPITRVVVPIDLLQDADDRTDDTSDELDWCFDDPELTQQLRAVRGSRMTLALVFGGIASAIGAFVLYG